MLGSTKQTVLAPIAAPEPAAPAPVQEQHAEDTMLPDANSVETPVISAEADEGHNFCYFINNKTYIFIINVHHNYSSCFIKIIYFRYL